MTALFSALSGGLILGFAGSFHCACMCGGIASGSLLMINPQSPRERLMALLQIQSARVSMYAVAGGLFAGLAGWTVDPWATAGTFKGLQWISGAALMWVGLAMAGVVPRIALPRQIGAFSVAAGSLLSPLRANSASMPIALGLTWGITPCPLVYAALFSATLTGSMAGGIAWMLGFGLGTVPAVAAAALGLTALTRVRRWRGAEIVAGLAVAALGLFSAAGGWPTLQALCTTP